MRNIYEVMSRLAMQNVSGVPTPPVNRFSVPEDAITTDYGNCLRFVHHFGKDVFYDHHSKRWFIWNGRCWEVDSRERIKQLATESVMKIREVELPHFHDPDQKGRLTKWIAKSLNKTRINSVVEMARGELPSPGQLDKEVYLLNVQNGTVDLRTGELFPHNRDHYFTKLCEIDFSRSASCPKWHAFLNMAFQGNERLIRYFQKVIGYCLTGDTGEKCFFICWGPGGNNGKSMIINVMRDILGPDYSVMIAAETLLTRRFQNPIRTDLVRLQGHRFASASETHRQYQFDEGLIKGMSGGDAITARPLRASEVEFVPEFKLFIATNHLPKLNLNDPALVERVVIIPFLVSIPQNERNRHFKDELLAEEREGILAWAVEGSVMWANEGLGAIPLEERPAAEVSPASSIEHFVNTCCCVGEGLRCGSSALYEAYTGYHARISDGSDVIPASTFYRHLSDLGYVPDHGRAYNERVGIALTSTPTG
ncbi:phage/plasmid primase, P4 family [Geomonas sp. RF6]|uniref:DNA primase family protein n=1 Tax=Geomonas sp. RF6 TaxID=2897342 RepID=UPI001E4CDAA8|nr:phage/plasmid primase, P4 family [Geomonas sp. RF6]UFS69477.1 phage/plasmid primase, P4 family [Geomonas sp. RF6]